MYVTVSTGPAKSDVAGSRLMAAGVPVVGRPLEPMVTGAIVRTLGAEPPWYGRPPRAGVVAAEAVPAEAVGRPRAVKGTSTRTVPTVPPGVGSSVRVCTIVPE